MPHGQFDFMRNSVLFFTQKNNQLYYLKNIGKYHQNKLKIQWFQKDFKIVFINDYGQPKKEESSTLGIISITCGLIGIFMAGFILGLIGLILGVIAWRKKETKVLYIIGITTSIIAFITSTMFQASIGILRITGLIF